MATSSARTLLGSSRLRAGPWPSACRWLTPAVPQVNKQIIFRALADVSIGEHPPGSNRSASIDQYLRDAGVPESEILSGRGYWCAAALGRWFIDGGAFAPADFANCDAWVAWAKQNGTWLPPNGIDEWVAAGNHMEGCAVMYGVPGDASHCGLIWRWDDYLEDIEGNTGAGGYTREGTCVAIKPYVPGPRTLGFIYPVSRLD